MLSKFTSPIFIAALIIIFLVIIIFILSYFECNTFKISKYQVSNTKNSDTASIIFISDFHNKTYKDNYKKLLDEIFNLNPDYIILGGDFIDFSKFNMTFKIVNYDNTIEFIKELAKRRDYIKNTDNCRLKQIFFTFGNHELRLKDAISNEKFENAYNKLIRVLNDNDVVIIDDRTISISDGISLSGLSLYTGYYYNKLSLKKNNERIEKEVLDKYFESLDRDKFNIISFHKPDYFKDLLNYGFDLVISGHNHGGLVRLPKIGAIISPDFYLFPKYDYGKYDFDDETLIISSGIGEHFIKLRINNLPEICYICIK